MPKDAPTSLNPNFLGKDSVMEALTAAVTNAKKRALGALNQKPVAPLTKAEANKQIRHLFDVEAIGDVSLAPVNSQSRVSTPGFGLRVSTLGADGSRPNVVLEVQKLSESLSDANELPIG
jgi:hypothetical protein